jgi:signal transduction histidine kinase
MPVTSQGRRLVVDAKEYADSIILTMPIPLLVLETDLRVRTASHTFYDTFRVTPEATEGHLIYELGNGQWNIPELRKLLEEVLPNNDFFVDYEVEHTFEEIGHCTMLLSGRRLDHLQLILLVIVDITRRKQIEVELKASYGRSEDTLAQLRAAQGQIVHQERLVAVGELAAGIAHDFNNILSIILLHVELGLRVPNQPEKLHTLLETIAQQSHRAAKMVQQILDFGRKAALQTEPVNLAALLTEQVESLKGTFAKNIAIRLSYGDDLYIANVDPTRIHQIFMNLAHNAADAMPDGGEITIDLKRFQLVNRDEAPLPDMEAGEWLEVSVSDTGTGISPAVVPHLFEPFFTTKDPGKGTGLGLAQVYGLVRQHHGHIAVQTKEGEGTTFVIYLPAMAQSASK